MSFTPRTSRYQCGDIAGDIANLNWYKYVYGTTIFNIPLPNCTTYAYGRTMEIYMMNGYDLSVRTDSYNPYWWNSAGSHYGNATTWYGSSANVWQKGSEPRLGAIACFDGSGIEGGHVAIVEAINENGSVNLSESAYGGSMFNYRTNVFLNVGQIDSYSGGRFQGYIYNPLEPIPPTPSKNKYLFYRRGNYVKILKYGRASSTGNLPIAKGIGWERYILRVYKNRPYPLQIGDIKTGKTTGFYKPDSVQLLKY